MVILGLLLSDVSDAVSSRLLTSLVTYKGVRPVSVDLNLSHCVNSESTALLNMPGLFANLPAPPLFTCWDLYLCICKCICVFVCLPTLSVHGSQGWPVRQYDEDEMMTQRYCVSRQFIRRPCVRYQQWVSTVDT